MPKLKSKRGAKKRFKVTGTGKVVAQKPFKRHILTKKANKKIRQKRRPLVLGKSDSKRMLRVLLAE